MAVINNKFGAPTGAELLADLHACHSRGRKSTRKITSCPSGCWWSTTWHDYAALVLKKRAERGSSLALNKLNAVPTTAYPTPARRPHHSSPDTERFSRTLRLSCLTGRWA
ncbi:sugar nucleotide-binding protein [Shigella flexneri]